MLVCSLPMVYRVVEDSKLTFDVERSLEKLSWYPAADVRGGKLYGCKDGMEGRKDKGYYNNF